MMGELMGNAPLGYRRDGRAFYLIRGGAEDPPEGEGTPAPPAPPAVDDTAALRAELDAMRAENAAAKAEAQQSAERLRALMAGDEHAPKPSDDDDTDDDTDDKGGPKPADPEMAKLQRALRAANRESKARREQADKLRADWEAQDNQRKEQLAEAQRLSEVAEQARQEAEARYKPATIKAAAVPALLAAGARPDQADKLVRLLDASALDVDGSGEVTGLAEQVAAAKADWPQLFAPPVVEAERPKPPRVSGGDRTPAEDRPQTTAERIAAQVLNGAA